MNATSHTAPPARTGLQRLIPGGEYPHLRVWAGARIAGGVVLTACGVLTFSFGGNDAKTYAWAAVFLGFAALTLAAGFWELTVARSASPRT